MRRREVYDWFRRHPYVLDVGIAGVLALFSAPGTITALGTSDLVLHVLTAGLIVPLVWRRTRPVAAFGVVSATCALQVIVIDRPLPANLAFLLVLYALSAYAESQLIRRLGLATGLLGALLAAVDWWGRLGSSDSALPSLIMLVILVSFTWTLGDLLRTRRAYVGELEERARRLEFERDQQARIARSAERARIAREMHDVVAHSLSIVVAQADGGLYAGEQDPKAAQQALSTIGVTGRQALAEMRRLLGVLRSEAGSPAAAEAGPAYAPQPGLDQIEQLVERVRGSGLAVQLEVVGEARELTGGAQLAVYRIVQEALTNTLKHAGPRATATVRLTYTPHEVRVEIEDDGRGAIAPDDGAGNGLNGMRERVALYGGTLRAGPRVGGGFGVAAVLPLSGPAEPGAQTAGAAQAAGAGASGATTSRPATVHSEPRETMT